MQVFHDYAKYYDLVYSNKNYEQEVRYICELINDLRPESTHLLDMGCGTGKHSIEFARNGYEVTGVDSSIQMIEMAASKLMHYSSLKNKPGFLQQDIRSLNIGHKFDVIVSLFHVMSYLETDEDMMETLESVKSHLHKGGLFIFDFWYGPAVLHQKPEKRINHYNSNDLEIKRISEPTLYIDSNIVDVHYQIFIKNNQNKAENVINETHRMRYYFKEELTTLMNNHGFKLLAMYEWLTRNNPDKNTWSVCAVVKLP